MTLAIEELDGLSGGGMEVPDIGTQHDLSDILNHFFAGLPIKDRVIFLRRYWYFLSAGETAASLGITRAEVYLSL